jgi:hypothetical protein
LHVCPSDSPELKNICLLEIIYKNRKTKRSIGKTKKETYKRNLQKKRNKIKKKYAIVKEEFGRSFILNIIKIATYKNQ